MVLPLLAMIGMGAVRAAPLVARAAAPVARGALNIVRKVPLKSALSHLISGTATGLTFAAGADIYDSAREKVAPRGGDQQSSYQYPGDVQESYSE